MVRASSTWKTCGPLALSTVTSTFRTACTAAGPASEPPPAWADAAGSAEPDVPSPADEAVKVIEHLRIGIPLYNVYLNEADEWSRRLCTSLQEWSLELHQPLPDTAVALAHSLAGSSATVGFTALSGMARTLEHALQHVQLLPQGLPEHAQVFNAAADDIRRLLHQFAAGCLKEPNALVLERLQALLLIEVSSSGRVPLEEAAGEEAGAGTAAEQGALGSILERELQVDEAIARAVQGAELLRHSTGDVVDAFMGTRLGGLTSHWGTMFGTMGPSISKAQADRIVERAQVAR